MQSTNIRYNLRMQYNLGCGLDERVHVKCMVLHSILHGYILRCQAVACRALLLASTPIHPLLHSTVQLICNLIGLIHTLHTSSELEMDLDA